MCNFLSDLIFFKAEQVLLGNERIKGLKSRDEKSVFPIRKVPVLYRAIKSITLNTHLAEVQDFAQTIDFPHPGIHAYRGQTPWEVLTCSHIGSLQRRGKY